LYSRKTTQAWGNSRICLKQLSEIEGISSILQRLLAGLIPVRAEVLDYVVVNIEGTEYIVHVDAIKEINIESKPLEIVCVTELDAYWKDIRRVLFSEAEFTMLARVSKTGLQTKWTPIKLADLMSGLVPDLTEQLDIATRAIFDQDNSSSLESQESNKLLATLIDYTQLLIDESGDEISANNRDLIEKEVTELDIPDQPATSQRKAFLKARELVSQFVKQDISPESIKINDPSPVALVSKLSP